MSRAAAALKTKGFPARAGRSRSKMRGHTTKDGALAAARVHGVSVGARRGAVAGPTFRRRVDRPHFLVAQNEGAIAGRTEKAFGLKAQTERSRYPVPTGAGAPVGTRLHSAPRNALDLGRNFKPLPTDRKLRAEQGLGVEAAPRIAQQHPADRHDRQTGVAPHGGAGADLDDAV